MGKRNEASEVTASPTSNTATAVISWHSLNTEEIIFILRTRKDLESVGLTSSEATERLAQYGHNQLTEAERETLCQKIWKQISNVLVLILVSEWDWDWFNLHLHANSVLLNQKN